MIRWRELLGRPGTREKDLAAAARWHGFTFENLDEALADACRALNLEIVHDRRLSYWHKSIGAPVRGLDGTLFWLKVSGALGPGADPLREGEESPPMTLGVPRPDVHKIHDWVSGTVRWRALLMTLAPSATVGRTAFASALNPVSDAWIEGLARALDAIGGVRTTRVCYTPREIGDAVTACFGRRAPRLADDWRAAHGDLNWSNVTAPDLCLLDWETWGLAPRGFDAATLIVYSCARPDLVARLRAAFAHDLDTLSGRVALLFVCARTLNAVEAGWFAPGLYRPVERLARGVLRSV